MSNEPLAYEAAAERIEEEFIDRIEHAHYYHEVMDGGHLYYSGGFEVSIETSRFDEPEHMKYLNYQEESEIADDIRSMLDRELSVYVNDVDIQSGDDETDFRMDIHAEGEATPDGYERYLEELAEYDSKYKGIVRVIELVLQKYDILPKGQLESFDEAAFERETENFSVIDRREYPGDEEIVLRSDREPIGMLLTPEQLQDLNFSTPYTTGSGRTYGFFNQSLSARVAGKLGAINQKIAASGFADTSSTFAPARVYIRASFLTCSLSSFPAPQQVSQLQQVQKRNPSVSYLKKNVL